MSRFRSIREWLKDCPYFDNYIYFNVIQDFVGATSLSSDAAIPGIINEFIDGTKQIELTFNISLIKDYDEGTSDLNLESIESFDNIDAWIREQTINGNFPKFDDGKVYIIQASYITPDIYIFNDESKCEYRAKYKLEYYEGGKYGGNDKIDQR